MSVRLPHRWSDSCWTALDKASISDCKTGLASELPLDSAANRAVVDGLRAIGMLMVVLFHVLYATSRALEPDRMREFIGGFPAALNFAWQALGSEIIFLLSGFLIAYLLLRELRTDGKVDLRRYAVKRASRILPLYGLALLIYAPLVRFDPAALMANLLMISKLSGAHTIIPVGWSLELIVQFYLLLPPLVLLMTAQRRPLLWLGLLIAVSIAARAVPLLADPEALTTPFYAFWLQTDPGQTQRDLYYLPWYRATPFLTGAWLAIAVIGSHEKIRDFWRCHGRWLWLVALGLLLASAMLPIQAPDSMLYTQSRPLFWLCYWTFQRALLTTAVSLVLLGAWFGGPVVRGFLAWRCWSVFSRNIYAIYLFHPLCLMAAVAIVFARIRFGDIDAVSNAQVAVVFVVTAALSAAVAELITRYLDNPLRDFLRRRYLG